MTDAMPRSDAELAALVAEAGARDEPIVVQGRGTKAGWGRAIDGKCHVSLAGFNGIVDYAAAELVMTAGAGTPLSEIRAALTAEGQHLAFEPIDLGPLFGGAADAATIGGVLASNLSGARRPFAGAARDYFLGFRGVNGQGEIFKAGGKVVKNVTGYDLPKLMAGSFGTLGLMTEVTLKVVPAPETSLSLVFPGLDVAVANQVMVAALGSTAEPSGAVFLPADMTAGIAAFQAQSATILRLEGAAASVAYRRDVLRAMFKQDAIELAHDASVKLWQKFGRLEMLAAEQARAIWLLSVPPASGAAVINALLKSLPDIRYFMDWGGGRIWLSLACDAEDAGASLVRAALTEGGHASLIRAQDAQRRGDHVFSPEAPIELLRRVRIAFDPKRLFNRGRLHSEL